MGPEAIVVDLRKDLAVGSLLVLIIGANMFKLIALVLSSKGMI